MDQPSLHILSGRRSRGDLDNLEHGFVRHRRWQETPDRATSFDCIDYCLPIADYTHTGSLPLPRLLLTCAVGLISCLANTGARWRMPPEHASPALIPNVAGGECYLSAPYNAGISRAPTDPPHVPATYRH